MQKFACKNFYAKKGCGVNGMGLTVHPVTKAEEQLTFWSN